MINATIKLTKQDALFNSRLVIYFAFQELLKARGVGEAYFEEPYIGLVSTKEDELFRGVVFTKQRFVVKIEIITPKHKWVPGELYWVRTNNNDWALRHATDVEGIFYRHQSKTDKVVNKDLYKEYRIATGVTLPK